MAKVILCKLAYIVKIDENNEEEDIDKVMQASNLIEKNFRIEDIEFEWVSSDIRVVDPERDNAGTCENCGAWTTDIYSDNPVAEMSIGTHVDGRLLCDLCLPKDHPLNFRFGGSEEIDFI